jgi:hypothetical protein
MPMQRKFFFLSWVLIALMTIDPLMAQSRPPDLQIVFAQSDEALQHARQRITRDAVTQEGGKSLLFVRPPKVAADAFPNGKSTTTSTPSPGTISPGKASAAVVMLLIAAGAAAVTILALSLGGNDKPKGPPATILAAGTPRVSSPPNP